MQNAENFFCSVGMKYASSRSSRVVAKRHTFLSHKTLATRCKSAFSGAGKKVVQLCKEGNWGQAELVFDDSPDRAGAAALIRGCRELPRAFR